MQTALVVAGCRTAAPPPAVWVVEHAGDLHGGAAFLSPDASVSPRKAKLWAAINETVGFLFAVRAEQTPVAFPELRVTPLIASGTRLDDFVFELFRVHTVPLDRFPGWHIRSIPPMRRQRAPLDVLVPLGAPRGGLPRALEPGVTYYFWADVSVPKGTTATAYTTSIQIFAKGEPVSAVPVELTVLPLVLPDEAEPLAIAEVDHLGLFRHHIRSQASPSPMGFVDWRDLPYRSQYEALLASTLRTLQRHRLTPVLHEFSPPIRVSSRGDLNIDWSIYDSVVEPLLDGRAFSNRVPLRAWPMPLHAMFAARAADPVGWASGSEHLLKDYLAQCAAHFADKGWINRAYALASASSPDSTEAIETTRRFAALARSADDRITVAAQLFPQDMGPYGWVGFPGAALDDDVRIWIPPAQFYDPQALAAQRDRGPGGPGRQTWGRRAWLGVDRPPFSGSVSIFAPPSYTDVLSWQCRALSAEAMWLGCVNHWPTNPDAGDPENCARFDANALLFPGRPFGLDEPVQTLRLKRLRDSLQTAAYARLLEQHDLVHVTTALQDSLVNYAGASAYRTHFADGRPIGWIDRHDTFELARRIMADEMSVAAESPRDENRSDSLGRSVAWKSFMSMTSGVGLRADGARLRLTGPPSKRGAEVEAWLTIVNGTRVPLDATIAFADLPEGWLAESEAERIESLSPNQSRLIALSCRQDRSTFAERRPAELLVELTPKDGSAVRTTVRLSSLVAEAIARSPAIDGDLSDWPPGAVNLASDFRLISGEYAESADRRAAAQPDAPLTSGGATARPARRTFGFALRDDEYLYLAINAETKPDATVPASRRRSVRYEDMIPQDDEDLVEVLIDPLNGGTRSPGDLYHIVVKRSGVYLTEQGLAFDPPCGTRRTWPADIDVATHASPDRWTAELRIPLAALGRGDAHSEVWGLNITRWSAAEQEFSTWSGAVGNAYDPLSLGNLILP